MAKILGIQVSDEHTDTLISGGVTGLAVGGLLGAGLFFTGGMGAWIIPTLMLTGVVVGVTASHRIYISYQLAGLTPPPIIIRRLAPEEGGDDPIIEISDFKIIDVPVLQQNLESGYNFDDKPTYKIKLRQCVANCGKHSGHPDP